MSSFRFAACARAPDTQAGAPRRPVSEQREAPLESDLRAGLSGEEVRALIAEAAYYRAKKRGFSPGCEEKDWLEAEAEVMTRLGLWE
jgi:hypothetical protein